MPELSDVMRSKLTVMNREYVRGVNRDLAKQNWQQLFSRNVVTVQQNLLKDLGQELSDAGCTGEKIKPDLMALLESFVQEALKHNRSSCAVSNFPDEHQPSSVYIGEVLAQCESLLDEFIQVNYER